MNLISPPRCRDVPMHNISTVSEPAVILFGIVNYVLPRLLTKILFYAASWLALSGVVIVSTVILLLGASLPCHSYSGNGTRDDIAAWEGRCRFVHQVDPVLDRNDWLFWAGIVVLANTVLVLHAYAFVSSERRIRSALTRGSSSGVAR